VEEWRSLNATERLTRGVTCGGVFLWTSGLPFLFQLSRGSERRIPILVQSRVKMYGEYTEREFDIIIWGATGFTGVPFVDSVCRPPLLAFVCADYFWERMSSIVYCSE